MRLIDAEGKSAAPHAPQGPHPLPKNPISTSAQVRRLMEADNAARRSARRKEFNQTVRELAAFVRKRDKRVAAWQAAQAQQRLDRQAAEQQRCAAAPSMHA